MDNNDRQKLTVEIWKTIVGVQQHFNDISMRIRSMFVTILLALFAAIGFLVDKRITLEVFGLKVQYATLLPLFGIVGTVLFYFIDRYWYHRLLVGPSFTDGRSRTCIRIGFRSYRSPRQSQPKAPTLQVPSCVSWPGSSLYAKRNFVIPASSTPMARSSCSTSPSF